MAKRSNKRPALVTTALGHDDQLAGGAFVRPSRVAQYSNARRTRLRPGPSARGGSAQSHLRRSDLDTIRRDCQALGRDNLIGRILINRHQDMIVGDGAVVTSTSDDQEWNLACDRLFNDWAGATGEEELGHCDIRERSSLWELLRLVVRSWLTDGDVLLRWVDGQVQAIEAERIVSPGRTNQSDSGSGQTIIDGVQSTREGKPVAYHVADWTDEGYNTNDPKPIEAPDAMFMPNPAADIVGLVRGEPGLQVMLPWVEWLEHFVQKNGLAAEVATLFGILIKTERPADTQAALEATTPDQPSTDGDERQEVDLQPGMVKYLKPGESVEQVRPEYPRTGFTEYVSFMLMLMGAVLCQPNCFSLFDAKGLSWSNIKSLASIAYRGVYPLQENLGRVVREFRARKVEQWVAEKKLDAPPSGWRRCTVRFPSPPVLDFKTEAEGFGYAVANNLMTGEQATQELGTGRRSDIVKARGSERKQEIAEGVVPAEMPGAKSPVEPAAPPETAEPTE